MKTGISSLLLLSLSLLSTSSSLSILPNTTRECSLNTVYTSWFYIRQYINRETPVVLSVDIKGPPLPVMRCYNDLAPCQTVDGYCGLASEGYVTKTLPLESVKYKSLILTFIEHTACKCMSKTQYDNEKEPIGAFPILYDVSLVEK